MPARTNALLSRPETGKMSASIILRCGRLAPGACVRKTRHVKKGSSPQKFDRRRNGSSRTVSKRCDKLDNADMDIKGPVKDATSTAKENIDAAAGQLQSAANSTTN
jgi:hypothetical protein